MAQRRESASESRDEVTNICCTTYQIDPAQNMDRWYLHVQATLFDKHAVIFGWGCRGTDQARWKIFPVETQVRGNEKARQIVATKIKRGYCIADENLSTG